MSLSDKIAIVALIISVSGFTIKGTIIYFKTETHRINAIFKNPYIQTFLGVLGSSVIIALIPLGRFNHSDNKPINSVIIKHDTVVKIIKEKADTLSISKPPNTLKRAKISLLSSPSIRQKIGKDTVKPISKYNFNAPISNSAVGDNATNYNYGIQPRKITEADINQICDAFPDKNINVYFQFYGFGDSEMNSVINQISSLLKQRGYINIDRAPHVTLGKIPPEKITLNHSADGKYLEIAIPPVQ